jgi:hypothetical protein
MKGFGTFDTTNSLYGNFYSRQQDPITNVPRYSKPNMEEEFYNRTLEMQKGYFNRYAHLYKDPTGKPIYNPMDGKAFKEEDAQRPLAEPKSQFVPEQPQQEETLPIQRPHVFSHEMEERQAADEPVTKTFRRNFEAESNKQ